MSLRSPEPSVSRFVAVNEPPARTLILPLAALRFSKVAPLISASVISPAALNWILAVSMSVLEISFPAVDASVETSDALNPRLATPTSELASMKPPCSVTTPPSARMSSISEVLKSAFTPLTSPEIAPASRRISPSTLVTSKSASMSRVMLPLSKGLRLASPALITILSAALILALTKMSVPASTVTDLAASI